MGGVVGGGYGGSAPPGIDFGFHALSILNCENRKKEGKKEGTKEVKFKDSKSRIFVF